MEGVWELTYFYLTANSDTLILNTNKTQHKIYLDGFVIWNVSPSNKTNEWHRFGTYNYVKINEKQQQHLNHSSETETEYLQAS